MKLFMTSFACVLAILCLGALLCLWVGGVPMVNMFIAASLAILASKYTDIITGKIEEDLNGSK